MIFACGMRIITDAELVEEVERFLVQSQIAPSRFGREVMGDSSLVQHLRGGRSLSLTNANKVIAYIHAHAEASDAVAMCGRCGERAEASQVTSCTSVHCPKRAQEAA